MGRSSEGSGHSRTCTLDATNDASLAPGRARQARGDSLSGITAGMREATEAVARCQPLRVTGATFTRRFAGRLRSLAPDAHQNVQKLHASQHGRVSYSGTPQSAITPLPKIPRTSPGPRGPTTPGRSSS